jgi:hypothetical protein
MLCVRTIGISEIIVGTRAIGPDRPASFALLLLTALRAPRFVPRAELATLLWHDASSAIRNHRMRSLLHRMRQAGASLECTDSAVRLAEPPAIDFRELSTPPRSLDDVRRWVAEMGPALPGLERIAGTPLESRLDDERDRITGTLVRWIGAALELAKASGDWLLVEDVARAGRRVDRFSEDAWASLAEAQRLTSSETLARRTLAAYQSTIGEIDDL